MAAESPDPRFAGRDRIEHAVDELWERLWASGISNPLTAIEQISNLLLLRLLDRAEEARPAGASRSPFSAYPEMRWAHLRSCHGGELQVLLEAGLIPLLTKAELGPDFAHGLEGGVFAISQPGLARECMEIIESLPLDPREGRAGEVYDVLLDRLRLSGPSGQFRTPTSVVSALVDFVDPRPGEIVCDPAAGTAGFLVETHRRLSGGRGDDLLGYDANSDMVRLGLANMVMHGIEVPRVQAVDTISRTFKWPDADIVVSNPPFGAGIERADVHPDIKIKATRSELLFLELGRCLLRPRGRIGILLPEGALFGRGGAYVEVRRRWLLQNGVDAVVSLPSSAFQPHSNVRTAVLFGRGSGGTERVVFGSVEDEAELPYLARAVRASMDEANRATSEVEGVRRLMEGMTSATLGEISERGWSLSPATYREAEEAPPPDLDPVELIGEVTALNTRIGEEIAAAREILERLR